MLVMLMAFSFSGASLSMLLSPWQAAELFSTHGFSLRRLAASADCNDSIHSLHLLNSQYITFFCALNRAGKELG